MNHEKKITMAHGSGGRATSDLIREIFAHAFANPVLDAMEDAAVVTGSEKIAFTTDSFVVDPLEFPGGDIGRLSVCGTVNDLLMRGAVPKYLTCGFVLQEGLDFDLLQRVVTSLASTAKEAGVTVVAGDTKVVEGNGGMFINTSGVGFVPQDIHISAANCQVGDAIIVSGNLGDHHAALLSKRMGISNTITSDCAPLGEPVHALLSEKIRVHCLRDITRGGLGTVLKELAEASQVTMALDEDQIPVDAQVRDFCGLMGLDPLYMGNEGKLVAFVAPEDAVRTCEILSGCAYGRNAVVIGNVTDEEPGSAYVRTAIGGKRVLDVLFGEGLPRIC